MTAPPAAGLAVCFTAHQAAITAAELQRCVSEEQVAAETQQLHNCWQMAVILDFICLFQQHLNLQVSPAQHGSMSGSVLQCRQ